MALSELQALHDALLRAYGSISQRASRLNPARPYLLAHIQGNSSRLRNAYTAAAQSEERQDVHDWLNKRADDLESFIANLDKAREGPGRLFGLAKKGWSVAATGYSAFVTIAVPTAAGAGLTAIVVSTINACFCEVLVYGFIVFALALLVVGVFGFHTKRSTFLSWRPEDERIRNRKTRGLNLYEVEQKLLHAVDAPRRGEIQWDVIAWFFLACAIVLYKYLAPVITSHTKKTVTFHYDPLYVAAALAAVGGIALWESWRRPWGWKPRI
jgi:hypothetical protein